ncbi:MAG TPA: CHAT domain-containing protein [Archangium sp.]|nr:CHAT domain-containing protein [Archangium sp.]
MKPEETTPYTLTIEIARAEGAGDPHAFRCMRQDYVFRSARGFGSAEFPWDEQVLGAMAQLLRPRPDSAAMQRLGEQLRTFLEQGLSTHEGWAHHEQALLQAVEAGRPVYLTFRFGAAELYSLPWELVTLRTTGQHLGELSGCLVQYEWPGVHPAPLPSRPPGPGRVLLGWSAAGGEVPWKEHREALAGAASGNRYGFEPEKDVVARLSLAALEQALREATAAGRPITVLHLLCHGTQLAGGNSGLVWDGAGGEPEVVDTAALRRVLAPYAGSLRLVVLCACYGGHAGTPGYALGSVAQVLHRVGLEAVVASRLPLSEEGSVRLAESFYGAWKGPGSVRPALLEARRALMRAGGLEWASLQLFSPTEPPRPAARLWRRTVLLGLGATAAGLLAVGVVNALPKSQPLGGQVYDEDGQPVADARVTLLQSQPGASVETRTDAQGTFHLELRAGHEAEVRFRVEKEGYVPYEGSANLGNTGLGFTLERVQ